MIRDMACCLSVAALLPCTASAQAEYEFTPLFSPDGGSSHQFGSAIYAYDVDHDGFDDLLVSEPGADVGSAVNSGRLWLFHGPTFDEIRLIESRQAQPWEELGFEFGSPRGQAFGDVNGDGEVDIVMPARLWGPLGEPNEGDGRVHIFLGPDWVSEWILYHPLLGLAIPDKVAFGASPLLADLDGDGRSELLIGSPISPGLDLKSKNEGIVWVWWGEDLESGITDQPTAISSPTPGEEANFGQALRATPGEAGQGDRLWVSAPATLIPNGLPNQGRLYGLFEGGPIIDAEPLLLLFGDLRAHADVTGDGIADYVIAAYRAKVGPGLLDDNPGGIAILEGPDYTLKQILYPPDTETAEFFGVKSEVADLDGDGDLDIAVGDEAGSFLDPSRLVIFHGPDFGEPQIIDPPEPEHLFTPFFGGELALADTDGDGLPELVAGATSLGGTGAVAVLSPKTLSVDAETLSVAAGDVVNFHVAFGPQLANHLFAWVVGASGQGDGVVLGHGSWLPIEPDALTAMGLALTTGPAGTLDELGRGSFTLTWAPGFGASLIGETLTLAVVTSPQGTRLGPCSSAVTLQIVP